MKHAGYAGFFTSLAATLVLAGGSVAQVTATPARNEVIGVTRPSEEAHLSFSNPGVVQDVPVKEHDKVKAGQPVLGLEDAIDKAELERLKLSAESNARVEAAEADLKAKTAKYKRVLEIFNNGGGNASEVEEAEADMILRQKQLDVAKEEQQEAKIKYQQQQEKVRKLMIHSPFDGVVEKEIAHQGEWADPQNKEGAIYIVKNDPLFIEVRSVDARQVAMMQAGQKLKVRYPDQADKAENWQDAEVVSFAPMVESSQTRLFKLRLANAQERPSGLEVIVKLPDNVANAAGMADAAAGK